MFLNNEVQLILGFKSDIISEKLLKQQNEQHGPAGHPGVADGGFSQQPCQVLIADNRQKPTFIPFQETGRGNQGKWEPNTEAGP